MRFSHSRFAALAAAVCALLAALATGCNRRSASSTDQATQPSPPETPAVKVVHPAKKDVRRLIERPSLNIEADERTALYAKIAGYVLKWNFDMGDTVHKDDILAELYVPEMEVELKQKIAAVGQAESEIKQADATVLRAKAELKRADSQYQRLERLAGVLEGKDQVEEYRLGFEAAQAASVKAAADVEVAKARLEVAKADRDHVQTLMQYTKIRAPYDGIITGKRTINIGDFVQPAAANKGESLFVVERIKPVRVFVQVQAPENVWVRDGEVALIRVLSLSGQQFKGTVTRTSKSLNPINRTLRTQIDLKNEDGKLLPGMFVNATIIAEQKHVWSLPAAAIVTKGEESLCYRVEGDKAVLTPIQVGLRGNEKDNELVEVLKKQMKPSKVGEEPQWEEFSGEEVIVAGDPASLKDGQPVSTSSDKN